MRGRVCATSGGSCLLEITRYQRFARRSLRVLQGALLAGVGFRYRYFSAGEPLFD
jgi:hypothetical protein